MLGIPSGPVALFHGSRLIMSCTSPSDNGWTLDLAVECRVRIEPVTRSFVDGVPSGQAKWATKFAAKSSSLPGASKTGLCGLFSGRSGGLLFIRDLLNL
ncbi:unnamed protein product [Macrosiphum euphorbiae]|uniref:Uncharacterized protein n=1 Tax=Macrosiphum euphorbiae TaxID=13131 RepID=A0AAV0X835_9HEMI|nr:unnamed protein product [Macrosiphum euphorbiae]